MRMFFRAGGTFPCTTRCARPSVMAVLPTPGSPTWTGLFLKRRQSTCSVRSRMSSRPISGSLSPARALSVSSQVYNLRNSPALPAGDSFLLPVRLPRLFRRGLRSCGGVAAVGNDVEQGEAADPLALHQVGGERFLLLEQRGVQVADLQELLFGGRRVDHGPLHQVLEPERGDGIVLGRPGNALVQVRFQLFFHQFDVGAAAVDDPRPRREEQRGVEDVLGGKVLVLAAAGVGEGDGEDAVQLFLDFHLVHGGLRPPRGCT